MRSSQVSGITVPVKTYAFQPDVWEQGAAPPKGVVPGPGLPTRDRSASRLQEPGDKRDRSLSANKADSLASSRVPRSPAPFNSTSKGRTDDKQRQSSGSAKRKPPPTIPEEGAYRPDLDDIGLKVVRLEGVITPNCNIENFIQDSRAVKQKLSEEGALPGRLKPDDIMKHNEQLTFESLLITDKVEGTNSMPKPSHNLNKAINSQPQSTRKQIVPDQILLTKASPNKITTSEEPPAETLEAKKLNPNFRIQAYDPKYDSEEYIKQIIARDTPQVPSLKTASSLIKQKKTLKEKAEEIYSKDLEELRLNKMMVAKQEHQLKQLSKLPKPVSTTTVTPQTRAKHAAIDKLKKELAKARENEHLYEDPNEEARGSVVEDDDTVDGVAAGRGKSAQGAKPGKVTIADSMKKDDRGRLGPKVAKEDDVEDVADVPEINFDLEQVDAGDQAVATKTKGENVGGKKQSQKDDPEPGELGTEGDIVLDLQGFGNSEPTENEPNKQLPVNKPKKKPEPEPKPEPVLEPTEPEIDIHNDSQFEDGSQDAEVTEPAERQLKPMKAEELPDEPESDQVQTHEETKISRKPEPTQDAKEGDIVMELPMIDSDDAPKPTPGKRELRPKKDQIPPPIVISKNDDDDDLPINSDIDPRFLQDYEFKYNESTGEIEKVKLSESPPEPASPAKPPIEVPPIKPEPAPLASKLKEQQELHNSKLDKKYNPRLEEIEKQLAALREAGKKGPQPPSPDTGVLKSGASGHLRVGLQLSGLLACQQIEAVQNRLKEVNLHKAAQPDRLSSLEKSEPTHKAGVPDVRGARERMAALLNDLEKGFDKDWDEKYKKKSAGSILKEENKPKDNPFDLERLKKMSLDELYQRNAGQTSGKKSEIPMALDPRLAMDAADPTYSQQPTTKTKRVSFAPKPPPKPNSSVSKIPPKTTSLKDSLAVTPELDAEMKARVLNSIVRPNLSNSGAAFASAQITKHPWIDFD